MPDRRRLPSHAGEPKRQSRCRTVLRRFRTRNCCEPRMWWRCWKGRPFYGINATTTREENAGQEFQGDTLTFRVILEPHDDFAALPLTGAPQRIKRQYAEHAHESCCMTRLILLRNRHRTGLVMGAAEAG